MADAIQRAGGEVVVCDPKAIDNTRKAFPDLLFASDAETAAADAHVVLHLTEWAE